MEVEIKMVIISVGWMQILLKADQVMQEEKRKRKKHAVIETELNT